MGSMRPNEKYFSNNRVLVKKNKNHNKFLKNFSSYCERNPQHLLSFWFY